MIAEPVVARSYNRALQLKNSDSMRSEKA